ncbi:peptidase m20 : Amidohydrolase OS=Haliscomenobacter hydrossis (strain ATCC 27775 / DSM 1100 / LMG 10767 / O) GN=Halhy_1186 PE=4 SV=1: Peptidase_M20: M20_dimer [Gemmata massiliana]|uniref:Peptidase M20 dimerisation domain-containing protein n=1 Tax=Gemmata massiliana TaxID=1210884 RepID=A0A6P2D012_9BACT|nr:amidohydrolase [Gemmata massiliana]VTR93705.1 peptidase m20 : Amidohydrolase OS=Haliscomenobacter hydrossis (strain ATCC 27775 / DSM 1100 / LMG 10767 / O) GN=Halhy_1186 PE=4 SV=1: Peptidase_M20: M20_dimer [Gemmata massiliana]
MLARRLSALVVLTVSLAVSGIEPRREAPDKPAQPGAKAQPNPPAGWVKERLAEVDKKLDGEIKDLVALYQHIHANPELSLMEVNTSKRLAAEMKKAGYEITEKFGGNGVVAVLKNGPGPVVLIRTDMDGLPIIEQTGLSYASKVKTKNRDGNEVGVMHACGHDVHMTSWTGTARVLASMKDHWSGTVVFVAQPAEEIVAGAKQMLDAGLYTKFPKPDYALALHSDPLQPAGSLGYSEGLALANSDTVDILVKGKGGHGASPHVTIDPIVLSARIILDLQTIVSRETDPLDPVVVTVGSIHGGTKHNIIPNEVKLQLTVRTTTNATRDRVLKAIDRIAKAAAIGANAPPPEVKVSLDEFTPATYNDVPLAQKCGALFREILGAENVRGNRKPVMGAEDFGRFSEGKTPTFMYFLGTISKEKFAAAQKPGAPALPGMHTDAYAPVPEPSIRTGVRTMSLAAMNLMPKEK